MSLDKSYYIESYYVRLFGLEEGPSHFKKPKLIFLHGLLGNSLNWLSIIKELKNHYEIAALDLQGHGKTLVKGKDHSLKEFCKSIEFVTKELGWEKFSIIGHSLGARVSFVYGCLHPEKLEKMVFEDMGPHKTGEGSRRTERMISSVPVPFASKKEAKLFFTTTFEEKFGKVLADYMYSNIQKTEDGQFDWRFDKNGALSSLRIGEIHDFWKEFEAISCPNLIIRGENSEHLPKPVFEEMLKRNKASTGVEIPGAGHWVHFDNKDAFVAEIKSFLEH